MNHNTMGEFIKVTRKAKGMTQKELADRIGVSDKTISKWETGNGVPDTQILTSLCNTLNISVNELLSGEKLPPENYSLKAEENMMDLLKENEKNRKTSKITIAMGMLLGLLAIVNLFITSTGLDLELVGWFIDLPSLIELILICAAVVVTSGAKNAFDIISIVQKSLIPAGIFVTLFSFVIIMVKNNNVSTLRANLAVGIITMLYAVLFYIILIPVSKRLQKKQIN